MRRCLGFVVALLFILVLAPSLRAQVPAITPGQKVRVFADSVVDSPMSGKVQSVSAHTFELLRYMDAPTVQVPWTLVREIHVPVPKQGRTARTIKGAAIGALVGGAALLGLAAALDDVCSDCPPTRTSDYILAGAIFAGGGAAAGATVAYLTTPTVWQPYWKRR